MKKGQGHRDLRVEGSEMQRARRRDSHLGRDRLTGIFLSRAHSEAACKRLAIAALGMAGAAMD